MPRRPGAPEPGTDGYTLQDVGRLLGLPRSIVRALIDAGFVAPLRGRRREYRLHPTRQADRRDGVCGRLH